MAKIIQVFKDEQTNHIVGLGDDGAVYEARYLGEWVEVISSLSRKKADKSVTVSGQPSTKKFTPPLVVDIHSYMMERSLTSLQAVTESDKFFDFYSSKGWMVGKNKMKDWKAAVRNWLKNYKPQQSTGGVDMDSTDWIKDTGGVL